MGIEGSECRGKVVGCGGGEIGYRDDEGRKGDRSEVVDDGEWDRGKGNLGDGVDEIKWCEGDEG